jgi:PmbA protein
MTTLRRRVPGAGGRGPGNGSTTNGIPRSRPPAPGTRNPSSGPRHPAPGPLSWAFDDALSLGEKAVRLALSKGADEAEAFLSQMTGSSVDIEGGRISYASQASASGISIRVLCKKRLGFAYCTHEDMIDSAAARALVIARIGKKTAFHFPDRASYSRPADMFDDKIASLTPDDSIGFSTEMVRAARAQSRGINVTGGGIEFGWSAAAIVNSNGVAIADSGTGISAGVSVTLKGRTVSTGFEHSSSRTNDIDFCALGERAARLAVESQNPTAVGTGRRTVVFTPDAFAALLGVITVPALFGEEAGRGRSVYSNMMGEAVASPLLTLTDDGLLPRGLGTSASDDEGVPSRRTVLLEKGVLRAFLYDLQSAADFGALTTASAARGSYRVPPGTTARNFIVEGGMQDRDNLISEINDGLLVHEVLGAHTASSVSGDFAVSAPLLFRIKDGKLGRPLKPVMLSGNLPVLLKGLTGIGNDTKHIPGFGGAIVTGSVRAENVMVTG